MTSAAIFLAGCGGGGSSAEPAAVDTSANLHPSTVAGTVAVDPNAVAGLSDNVIPAAVASLPATLYLDDGADPIYLDGGNRFVIPDVADGDHSLFLQLDGNEFELPFRMAAGRGLDFGTITMAGEQVRDFTGFNGYRMGWIDEDGDTINDNFADVNGDGIVDPGFRYAGYAYFMDQGFIDENGDGVNDRFADADGDGVNDLTGRAYGFGFGFIDEDGDGVNDRFADADGDGICDLSAMPYQHPFGFIDEDGDGVNDRFTDADGDGINDLTQRPYVAMPGWVDLDGDGVNDFFVDADGDGINDRFIDENGDGINDLGNLMLSYGHGFGWVDADGDGINDHFVDANGDGINDLATGPLAGQNAGYGFRGSCFDADGDGINDDTGQPFRHGFGWVDNNDDGVNDVFVDEDGDGVNDLYGYGYSDGYRLSQSFSGPMGGGMQEPLWPMRPRH